MSHVSAAWFSQESLRKTQRARAIKRAVMYDKAVAKLFGDVHSLNYVKAITGDYHYMTFRDNRDSNRRATALIRMANDPSGLETQIVEVDAGLKTMPVYLVGQLSAMGERKAAFTRWVNLGMHTKSGTDFAISLTGGAPYQPLVSTPRSAGWFAPEADVLWALNEPMAQHLTRLILGYSC